MIVKELIKHLREFNVDLEIVCIGHCGEVYDLDKDNFRLYRERFCKHKKYLEIVPPDINPPPDEPENEI